MKCEFCETRGHMDNECLEPLKRRRLFGVETTICRMTTKLPPLGNQFARNLIAQQAARWVPIKLSSQRELKQL